MNPGSFANAQDDVLQAFSNIAFNIELALICHWAGNVSLYPPLITAIGVSRATRLASFASSITRTTSSTSL